MTGENISCLVLKFAPSDGATYLSSHSPVGHEHATLLRLLVLPVGNFCHVAVLGKDLFGQTLGKVAAMCADSVDANSHGETVHGVDVGGAGFRGTTLKQRVELLTKNIRNEACEECEGECEEGCSGLGVVL